MTSVSVWRWMAQSGRVPPPPTACCCGQCALWLPARMEYSGCWLRVNRFVGLTPFPPHTPARACWLQNPGFNTFISEIAGVSTNGSVRGERDRERVRQPRGRDDSAAALSMETGRTRDGRVVPANEPHHPLILRFCFRGDLLCGFLSRSPVPTHMHLVPVRCRRSLRWSTPAASTHWSASSRHCPVRTSTRSHRGTAAPAGAPTTLVPQPEPRPRRCHRDCLGWHRRRSGLPNPLSTGHTQVYVYALIDQQRNELSVHDERSYTTRCSLG